MEDSTLFFSFFLNPPLAKSIPCFDKWITRRKSWDSVLRLEQLIVTGCWRKVTTLDLCCCGCKIDQPVQISRQNIPDNWTHVVLGLSFVFGHNICHPTYSNAQLFKKLLPVNVLYIHPNISIQYGWIGDQNTYAWEDVFLIIIRNLCSLFLLLTCH